MISHTNIYKDDFGNVEQITLHFTSTKSNIKNKKIIIGKNFKNKITYYYEKHFFTNGFKVVEEYYNNKVSTYYRSKENLFFKITEGFNPDGTKFFVEKLYYDFKGNIESHQTEIT